MQISIRTVTLLSTLLLFSACRAGGQLMGPGDSVDLAVPSSETLFGGTQATATTVNETGESPAAQQEHAEAVQTFEQIQTLSKPAVTEVPKSETAKPEASPETKPTPEPVAKTTPQTCLGYIPAEVDAVIEIDPAGLQESLIWSQVSESSYQKTFETFSKGVKEACVGITYSKTFKDGISQSLTQMVSPETSLASASAADSSSLSLLGGSQSISSSYVPPSDGANLSISNNISSLSSSQNISQESSSSLTDAVESYVLVVLFEAGEEARAKTFISEFESKKKEAQLASDHSFDALTAGADKNVFIMGDETMMSSVIQGGNLIMASSHPFAAPLSAIRPGANIKFAGLVPASIMTQLKTMLASVAPSASSTEETSSFSVLGLTASTQKIYLHALLFTDQKTFFGSDPLFEALVFLKTEGLSIDKLTGLFSSTTDSSASSSETPLEPAAPPAEPEVQMGEQAPLNLMP